MCGKTPLLIAMNVFLIMAIAIIKTGTAPLIYNNYI